MCQDDLGACRPIDNYSSKEKAEPNQNGSFLWSLGAIQLCKRLQNIKFLKIRWVSVFGRIKRPKPNPSWLFHKRHIRPEGECSEGLDEFRFFFEIKHSSSWNFSFELTRDDNSATLPCRNCPNTDNAVF